MNTLVTALQNDILSSKDTVAQLLRRMLLISQKLNLKELERWATNELNGYKNIDEVPKYREVQGQVSLWNHLKGVMISVNFDTEQESTIYRKQKITQRISEIESLVHKNESEKLYLPFPDVLSAELIKKNNWQNPPVLKVERNALQGILEGVKDHMYKWTIRWIANRSKVVDSAFTGKEKELISESGSITFKKIQPLFGNAEGRKEGSTERRRDLETGD
jgi:hypothetical protein